MIHLAHLAQACTVCIHINAPGVMHFSKGGLLLQIEKNQLSSPVAMGDNGTLTALISLTSMYNSGGS